MYALPLKCTISFLVTVIRWKGIFIPKGCLRGITFFLLDISDTISCTEIFHFPAEAAIWDIDKGLIVTSAYVCVSLEGFVISDYKCSYIMADTIVDDHACRFAHIVIYFVISAAGKRYLSVRLTRFLLLVFDRLQPGIPFVIPLVDGF